MKAIKNMELIKIIKNKKDNEINKIVKSIMTSEDEEIMKMVKMATEFIEMINQKKVENQNDENGGKNN